MRMELCRWPYRKLMGASLLGCVGAHAVLNPSGPLPGPLLAHSAAAIGPMQVDKHVTAACTGKEDRKGCDGKQPADRAKTCSLTAQDISS